MKNRIRLYREKLGLSQTQLAAALHVSKNSVSMFELQEMQPRVPVVAALLRLFDCGFFDLFFDD